MNSDYYKETFDINWADETNSEILTLDKLNNDNFTLLQMNIEKHCSKVQCFFIIQ
jgi:hypothetical protein